MKDEVCTEEEDEGGIKGLMEGVLEDKEGKSRKKRCLRKQIKGKRRKLKMFEEANKDVGEDYLDEELREIS